jgi:hypothetical protein
VKKTHDYIHHYRGYWSDGGRCRIRIYHEDCPAPVVICSLLPDNTNTSVTYVADRLLGRVHSASRVLSGVPVGAVSWWSRRATWPCPRAHRSDHLPHRVRLLLHRSGQGRAPPASRQGPKRADPPDSRHPRALGFMF